MNLETLIARIELDATRFHRQLDLVERDLQRTDRTTRQTTTRMRTAFQSPVASISALRGAVTALAGSLAIRQVLSYADAFTGVQNSLRVAGVQTDDLTHVTRELFDVANRTRMPVEPAQL